MSRKDNKLPKDEESMEPGKLEEGQEFVDDIPLEDLKLEMEDEKKKHKTKDDSQSERKFKPSEDN